MDFKGNLQIISSPQTVSNATLGSTVRFVCQTSITSVLPGWNINGTDYRVTELPLGYRSESYLTSNVLIVSPVEIAMNNSVYFCFVTSFTSEGRQVRIESEPAMIIIRVPNYSKFMHPYSGVMHACDFPCEIWYYRKESYCVLKKLYRGNSLRYIMHI